MASSKRILFSFDPRNFQALQNLASEGQFTSAADAVRSAVQIARVLQAQAKHGFSEVLVRNPHTREERVLVLPTLDPPETESSVIHETKDAGSC